MNKIDKYKTVTIAVERALAKKIKLQAVQMDITMSELIGLLYSKGKLNVT